MRVDHFKSDLKTSPSARFSNHSGRVQLSQVGSQMNIITSKHTLLYNSTSSKLTFYFIHTQFFPQLLVAVISAPLSGPDYRPAQHL